MGNKFQHFGFLLHNILQHCQSIPNSKTLAVIGGEKSVMDFFIGEKDKWTNVGNDKQEEADSLLHNTNHTQYLYHISKSYAQQFRRCFGQNFPMHYIGVKDVKMEEGKNKSQQLGFPDPLYVFTKFEDSGFQRSWEICDESFIKEKAKMDN